MLFNLRLTLSLLNFPLTHLRHGYYLKRRCFVCLGTKKVTKEKLRCKMDIESMQTIGPAQKDRNNRPTTARAEQPADHRPTTGLPSVIERCKAGAAPVYLHNSHLTDTTAPSTGTTAGHI